VIYAKIKARTFTVTFEGLEAKQPVEYGKTASKPETDPTKDGYTFDGWDFDFSTPIKADTEIKAKWVEEAVAQTWAPFRTVELAKNEWTDGANYQAMNSVLPCNYQAKKDDVIKLVLKGTSNKDISNLKAVLIDNGKKENSDDYNWIVLSDYVVIAESIKANEEFEYSVKIPVKTDSSASGSDYCKVVLMCDYADESDSRILTFVEPDIWTRVALYEGEGFKAYGDKFDASKLKEYLDSSTGGAKLVFHYKFGNYTPENNYDGIGALTGWDEKWVNSTDDFKNYGFNIPCAKDKYADKVGTEQTKEFDVKTLLSDLKNTHKFTINIYADSNKTPKAVFTKIEVVYTAK